MRTTGKLLDAYRQGGKTVVRFLLDSDTGLADLKANELLDIKAEKHINKRSNTANGYLWALITEIAKVIEADPIEVYRECIRRAGVVKVFDNIPPDKIDNAIRLMSDHKGRGTGNFAEVVDVGGKPVVAVYFGSSCYNAKEFSRLLTEVIDEAKELGIDTITPSEIERLKAQYEVNTTD